MRRVEVRPSVAVHGLFVAFGFVIAAFFPFLALYLSHRGLEEGEIGIVILVMAVARVIFLPIWGHLADTRTGRVTALRVGAFGTAVTAFAMNRAGGLVGIAVIAFVISAFMVATGPNIDAIALVHLGEERMSDYARIRAWESLSYAAACLGFGALLEAFGVRWSMPIYGLASFAVVLWASATFARDTPDPTHHGRLGAVGAVFREAPRFWGFLVTVLLLWTGFNAAWNFFSLKIEEGGGGPWLVGVGTALGGVIELGVMRASSRLQKRWGLRVVYILGCLLYALGFFLWALVDSPILVSILTGFEGMAFALVFTTGVVIVGKLLPPNLYSTGNSVAGMVGFGIGPIIGAGAGGFVYQYAGGDVLFAIAGVLAILAAVAAWFALSPPQLSLPLRASE